MFKGKAIILYGSRQVGKTTILHNLAKEFEGEHLILDCDEPDERLALENVTSTQLKNLFGKARIVFIDEAQRVKNIGITLKLITDKIKNVQVVATGSSALDMSSEINEPLTGRKYEFQIHPFTVAELTKHSNKMEEARNLEQRMIYGMYPNITQSPGEAELLLRMLANSYLYKDLLTLDGVRKSDLLQKLLMALALQLGNEVSYSELARTCDADKATIGKYIDLLEKTFIIFKLSPYSNNLRSEISKSRKIYFWDNGVRNAIISNFMPLSSRTDVGALWENFVISERIKNNHNKLRFSSYYFWRTRIQQEIDLVEVHNQQLFAYECKWSEKAKARIPSTFMDAYKVKATGIITRKNYLDYIL
jgi:predicted AAA+ superfamily ATPase